MALKNLADLVFSEPTSYAGKFWETNQSPQKTFMGNEPCVPLGYVADALRAYPHRPASDAETVQAAKHALAPHASKCKMECDETFAACVAVSPGQWKACTAAYSDVCIPSCRKSA